MGIGILALALIGIVGAKNRTVWLWTAITFVFLLLAMGDQLFLYPALRKLVPQLGFMRFPVKFVTIAARDRSSSNEY